MHALADLAGVRSRFEILDQGKPVPCGQAVALCGRVARELSRQGGGRIFDGLRASDAPALLFDLADSPEAAALLSGGQVEAGGEVDAGGLRFGGERSLCGPLAGLKGPSPGCRLRRLRPRGPARCQALIGDGASHFFAALDGPSARLFISSGGIADVGRAVRGDDLRPHLPHTLPALIFLRHAFPGHCWRSPGPQACWIIDDPPLKPRYGFFDYKELLGAIERAGFAATIAFIPWNYRRTDPAVAKLVRDNQRHLSICVHGCDHSEGEFGIDDPCELLRRARLARWRMEEHRRGFAVPYDNAMVFPQGSFSSRALAALRQAGFDAAVNSTSRATDGGLRLPLGEWLQPAAMTTDGLAFFHRRYPGDMFDFGLDAFLGRPLLIVEHHEFFKSGWDGLEEFVVRLGDQVPGLVWRPLGDSLSGVCRTREGEDGVRHLQFYSSRMRVSNPDGAPKRFALSRRQCAGAQVRVDGELRPNLLNGSGELRGTLELAPGKAVEVVSRPDHEVLSAQEAGLGYRAKVSLRRRLSEWRDNYLSKNEALLSASRALKTMLPRL